MQVNGHFMAQLDPLGLDQRPTPVELDPALYGFEDKDMDRECAAPHAALLPVDTSTLLRGHCPARCPPAPVDMRTLVRACTGWRSAWSLADALQPAGRCGMAPEPAAQHAEGLQAVHAALHQKLLSGIMVATVNPMGLGFRQTVLSASAAAGHAWPGPSQDTECLASQACLRRSAGPLRAEILHGTLNTQPAPCARGARYARCAQQARCGQRSFKGRLTHSLLPARG